MINDDDKKILDDIAEQLRVARDKARLTQAEVAKAAGINVNYYAQIERGIVNTSIVKLCKIAKVLKIRSIKLP